MSRPKTEASAGSTVDNVCGIQTGLLWVGTWQLELPSTTKTINFVGYLQILYRAL